MTNPMLPMLLAEWHLIFEIDVLQRHDVLVCDDDFRPLYRRQRNLDSCSDKCVISERNCSLLLTVRDFCLLYVDDDDFSVLSLGHGSFPRRGAAWTFVDVYDLRGHECGVLQYPAFRCHKSHKFL